MKQNHYVISSETYFGTRNVQNLDLPPVPSLGGGGGGGLLGNVLGELGKPTSSGKKT